MRLGDVDKLKDIMSERKANETGWYGRTLCNYVIELIDNMETIEAEPVVHGEWLPCGFGKEIMCSVCRCELGDVWQYRYCPNCGAKMKGAKL